MSLIHIARNNAVLGQFSEEDVRTGLANGTYLATDLAWKTGHKDWLPLGQWTEFAAPGSLPPPIYTTEEATMPVMPSWEHRQELGKGSAFFKSVYEIVKYPAATFSKMKPDGGIVGPLSFLMIPVAISAAIQACMGGIVTLSSGHTEMIPAYVSTAGAAAVIGYFLATGIFGGLLSAFLKPAIVHLFLILYKGANSGYETTFRASTYATGAVTTFGIPAAAIMLIPVVGLLGMIVMVPLGLYGIVLESIAISRAHRTDTWRVVMAFVTPMLICCCLYMVAVLAFVGLYAGIKASQP